MQTLQLRWRPAYSTSEPSQLLLLSGVSSPPPMADAAAAAAAACSAAAAAIVRPAAVLGLLPATLLTLLPGTAASPSAAAVPVLAAAGESQRLSAMSLRSAAVLASAVMRPACSFQKSTCLRSLQQRQQHMAARRVNQRIRLKNRRYEACPQRRSTALA
jgi:hypothetical protein